MYVGATKVCSRGFQNDHRITKSFQPPIDLTSLLMLTCHVSNPNAARVRPNFNFFQFHHHDFYPLHNQSVYPSMRRTGHGWQAILFCNVSAIKFSTTSQSSVFSTQCSCTQQATRESGAPRRALHLSLSMIHPTSLTTTVWRWEQAPSARSPSVCLQRLVLHPLGFTPDHQPATFPQPRPANIPRDIENGSIRDPITSIQYPSSPPCNVEHAPELVLRCSTPPPPAHVHHNIQKFPWFSITSLGQSTCR